MTNVSGSAITTTNPKIEGNHIETSSAESSSTRGTTNAHQPLPNRRRTTVVTSSTPQRLQRKPSFSMSETNNRNQSIHIGVDLKFVIQIRNEIFAHF